MSIILRARILLRARSFYFKIVCRLAVECRDGSDCSCHNIVSFIMFETFRLQRYEKFGKYGLMMTLILAKCGRISVIYAKGIVPDNQLKSNSIMNKQIVFASALAVPRLTACEKGLMGDIVVLAKDCLKNIERIARNSAGLSAHCSFTFIIL